MRSDLERRRRPGSLARKRSALIAYERPVPDRQPPERSPWSYVLVLVGPMLLVAVGALLFVVGHWVWP